MTMSRSRAAHMDRIPISACTYFSCTFGCCNWWVQWIHVIIATQRPTTTFTFYAVPMMHAVIYTSQGTSTKLWYVYISSSSTFLFGAAHHAHVSIDPANDWSRQRQNIHSFNDFIYNNFHARNNLRNWYRLSGAWCAAVYIEEWRDCWPHRFYPWHHTKYVCVCVCGSTKYQHIHAA